MSKSLTLDNLYASLKSKIKIISIVIVSFSILGFLVAITSPDEFKSTLKVLPESSSSSGLESLGTLGDLGSLAGVSLSSDEQSIIDPDLYASILNSNLFLVGALQQEYYWRTMNDTISIHEYLMVYEKKGLLGRLFNVVVGVFFKTELKGNLDQALNQDFMNLSKELEESTKELRKRISLNRDEESGIITIEVKMQDPDVAAKLNEYAYAYLKKYVINFATKKQRENLTFLKTGMEEGLSTYIDAERELSVFLEQNINLVSKSEMFKEEMLRTEFTMKFNLYQELKKQYEQSKIELKRNTPVFSVLDPITIPEENSEPNRVLIFVVFLLGGGMLISAYILKDFVKLDWN